MSDDERLQRWLGEEPGRLRAPGPAPVEAVFGRARAARARKRAAMTAGLAVLAVAGVTAPILATQGPWGSASGNDRVVTVDVPRTDAHGGTVFSGTDDGKRWTVKTSPGSCAPEETGIGGCGPQGAYTPTVPAILGANYSATSPLKYWVHVRSDIARLDVELTDGEVLHLTAAEVSYTRVALFQLPRRVGIATLSAYSADGTLISYAIPYQTPDAAVVAMWYRPGEKPTIPEASGTITGSTATGAQASVQVHIGPFGICYTVQRAYLQSPVTNCTKPDSTDPGTKTLRSGDEVPASLPDWVALGGQVDRNVDHVDFVVTTGTYRAQAVHIGGYTFAVCFLDPGFSTIGRTLYDASGTVLDHETVMTKS